MATEAPGYRRMDHDTARRLNEINRAFYAQTARDFDATRQRPWTGWTRALRSLGGPVGSVVDIGCGNGRFARFLAKRQAQPFNYCGIDNNARLLAYAAAALAGYPQARVELLERDVVMDDLPSRRGQVVALFGVLHHVPGRRRRRDLLRAAADCVGPGGWLAFSAWRFMDSPKLRERVVPFLGDLSVEAGDYLLDWRRGGRALRYCHYVDDAEHEELVAAAGLRVVDDWRDDGGLNRYTVMRREQ